MIKPIHSFIAAMVMLGILWFFFESMNGNPVYVQDYCDGSSRVICP